PCPTNPRSVRVLFRSLAFFAFLLLSRPPTSTLFPYTTLFRSRLRRRGRQSVGRSARRSNWLASMDHRRTRGRRANARSVRRSNRDRKSTRLNSSHQIISYAVFCLKKKTKDQHMTYDAQIDSRA